MLTTTTRFNASFQALLVAWLLVCVALPARAQADDPILAAESIAFDGGVVLLDRKLIEHREWLVETIEAEIKAAKQGQAINHLAIQRVARQITAAGFDLLGYEKEGEAYEEALSRCVDELIDGESPAFLLPDRVNVFVLNLGTAKDYLRAGGTLPFTAYNQATDRASINIGMRFSDQAVLLPNLLIVDQLDAEGVDKPLTRDHVLWMLRTVYLYPKDRVQEQLATMMEELPPKNPAYPVSDTSLIAAASALAGPVLYHRTRLHDDQHTRWFAHGLKHQLGELILQRLDAQRAARLYRALMIGKGIDELPDPGPENPGSASYLRYMPYQPILLQTSELDKNLRRYRIAASMKEVGLLIEHITLDRLPELVQAIEQEQIGSTRALEAMIQTRFGYDISARLDLYQPHDTAQATYDAMIQKVFEHRANGDIARMLASMQLAHEAQLGEAMPGVPGIYKMLHDALSKTRGERAAVTLVIRSWWQALEQQEGGLDNDQRFKLAFTWTKAALFEQDLTLAHGLLAKLDEQPVEFAAHGLDAQIMEQVLHLVRASKHLDQGELQQARAQIDRAIQGLPGDTPPPLLEQHILPVIERLEMRLNTRRPIAPALG